mgnify:FL=1
MKLFKNEVGRPSNETLKKRKIAIIAIIIAVVLLVGGVTFTVVRTLKPIEGSGKKAEANRFVVAKNSNTCYTVYAPTNAKYWGVHVYYKQTGANTFGNRMVFNLSKYHDNDGVKSQKICFKKQKYENETFRILVKWNKGSNHKVYKTPNAWKPNGYYANNSIGWAYKDYAINWRASSNSNNSSNNNQTTKPLLIVTEPSQTNYNSKTIVTIKYRHNQNKTMYYTFDNYNKGNIGYRQSCSPINANQTKAFTLLVNKGAESRYSIIKLYSDSSCSKQVDSKKTKTYYYFEPNYAKLKVNEPEKTVYGIATKVQISFSTDTNLNTLFYKFQTYHIDNNYKTRISYSQNCSVIKKGDIKKFSMDIGPKTGSRYAIIELFSDNRCQNRITSKKTRTYMYHDKNKNKLPNITKACQKNGYVYVTASDDMKIEWIDWANNPAACNINTAIRVNSKYIDNYRINKKLSNNKLKYVCVWDSSNEPQTKKVDKSC